jgi:hypothetical protein
MKTDSQGYVWCIKIDGDNIGKERWMAPSFANNKSMMKELGWKVWEPEQLAVAPNGEPAKIKVNATVSTSTMPEPPVIEFPIGSDIDNKPIYLPPLLEPGIYKNPLESIDVVEKPKRKRKVTKRKYTRKPKTEAHAN